MTWEAVRPEVRLWTGDALAGLATLPDASVQCCVTSPPYYGLRDYGTATWEGGDPACEHKVREHAGAESSGLSGGKKTVGHAQEGFRGQCPRCGAIRVDDQIGMEETPDAYVVRLVAVFREVRRVLRDDGVVFVNLGDTYNTAGRNGLKTKDLIGIPWTVAFALRADGWYLRQDLVWSKKNCLPESVTDRCTKSHEYVFLLTKRERYFFDAVAIREPAVQAGRVRADKIGGNKGDVVHHSPGAVFEGADDRNRRSVWHLATEVCTEAHFATMPTALAKLCIQAGTSERGACAACGAPWRRVLTERVDAGAIDCEGKWQGEAAQSSGRRILARMNAARKAGAAHDAPFQGRATAGWEPSCGCGEPAQVPCTVLDPFAGSGTTGLVALRYDRQFVGCELNPAYAAMAARRLRAVNIQLALL